MNKAPENFSARAEAPPICCSGSPIPIWDADGNLVEAVGSAMANYGYKRDANGSTNFGSYIKYTSYRYNRTGTAVFGGTTVTYHVSSSTSVYSQNNPFNSFVSYRETISGNHTFFDIRNGQGNTLMSIKVESSHAQDVRDEIRYGNH